LREKLNPVAESKTDYDSELAHAACKQDRTPIMSPSEAVSGPLCHQYWASRSSTTI
jgi:hypothetical protein